MITKDDYFQNVFDIGNYRRDAQVLKLGKDIKEHTLLSKLSGHNEDV